MMVLMIQSKNVNARITECNRGHVLCLFQWGRSPKLFVCPLVVMVHE